MGTLRNILVLCVYGHAYAVHKCVFVYAVCVCLGMIELVYMQLLNECWTNLGMHVKYRQQKLLFLLWCPISTQYFTKYKYIFYMYKRCLPQFDLKSSSANTITFLCWRKQHCLPFLHVCMYIYRHTNLHVHVCIYECLYVYGEAITFYFGNIIKLELFWFHPTPSNPSVCVCCRLYASPSPRD